MQLSGVDVFKERDNSRSSIVESTTRRLFSSPKSATKFATTLQKSWPEGLQSHLVVDSEIRILSFF